ncbi:PREDICTED: GATA transcription factor 5-like [Ipomoea nil]|uniref:GATA transcription factor 5-like n=1 Tax=Ipomoea nil TaxID=35883 RepID=UPI000901F8AA|nr:PREDICTED: GATA transcription factor 5-like [Ipomoea nil]XP_019182721.1 PREDICTED: GATA transcription factor 5-like [Ipomoea nil]
MLYRTQHHSFLNPFTFSSSALSLTPPPSSAVSVQGMECALKSSVRPEMAAKTAHPLGCLENELPAVGSCQGGGGDDFFVDDLLDLSNGFSEEYEEKEKTEVPEEKGGGNSGSLVFVSVMPEKRQEEAVGVNFCIEEDFSCFPGGGLNAPADDLDSLEWLSHFVEEDSFSGYSLTYPAGKLPPLPENKNRVQAEIPVRDNPSFTTPVQTKARSKRARTGVRVWLSGSPSLTESSTSSSSSTTTMSSSPPHPFFPHPNQTAESLIGLPPAKKQKKKATHTGGGGGGQQQPRRCSHCGVQKTPQWRAGPLGAKTLCNACGVRFKSGRLLPEYRPACSPTFSSQLHSNNHRKVLEMRRKKESEDSPGFAPPVQSF